MQEDIDIFKMQDRIDQNLFDPTGKDIKAEDMHLYRKDLDIYFKYLRSQGMLKYETGRNQLVI